MKSAITFGLGFLVLHFLLIISLNLFGDSESETYSGKDQLFEIAPTKVDYMFLGNSRTNAAIDSSYFENSFNFAHSGEFYWQMYYRLKHTLLHTDKKIHTVFLPAELGSGFINYNRLETDGLYWRNRIKIEELSHAFDYDLDLMSMTCLIKLFPYYRLLAHGTSKQENEEADMENDMKKSREQRFYNLSKKDKRKETESKLEQVTSRITHFDGGHYYLEKSIQLCMEHDVKPIFLKYPMTRAYRKAISAHIQELDYNPHHADSIIAKYDATLIDITAPFQDNDRLFANPSHLNKLGKQRFSKRLARLMIKYKETPGSI